jgi:hypothetical protein
MAHIPTVVGVISCGFLLCLGLSGDAASAADEINAGQAADRIGGQADLKGNQLKGGSSEGSKTIKGEVSDVQGDNLFVKGQDGNEVRLHIDDTTQKAKNIERGERIEVKVNDQNHALSILSEPAVTDRRNDKE